VANYHITDRYGRCVPVKAAHYDPATFTVTLLPSRRLDVHRGYTLKVRSSGAGGLTGASGIALDGTGTGRPGTDFTARITWVALNLPGRPPAVTFVNGRPRIMHGGTFQTYAWGVVRATRAAAHSLMKSTSASAGPSWPHPTSELVAGAPKIPARGEMPRQHPQ
jgi:hypothetical protein